MSSRQQRLNSVPYRISVAITEHAVICRALSRPQQGRVHNANDARLSPDGDNIAAIGTGPVVVLWCGAVPLTNVEVAARAVARVRPDAT